MASRPHLWGRRGCHFVAPAPPLYFLNFSNDWWGCCLPPRKGFTLQRSAGVTSKWLFFPGLPSWSPEIVPVGVSGLWALITPDYRVWSQWGLNQSCNPRRHLSNAMSHFQFGGRKEVDSRLLVVGSQTASLTPGPSFAHNLGCRCPNDQCEAIFDIYASRPFQWHQEHLNARCFGPCCRALNIRESRRTPNPQLWECWASPPHLAKVGLRHFPLLVPIVAHDWTF
jgi:hypothetical protein